MEPAFPAAVKGGEERRRGRGRCLSCGSGRRIYSSSVGELERVALKAKREDSLTLSRGSNCIPGLARRESNNCILFIHFIIF